ncbi:MAG TPA: phosphotyrosine protein phosphatase [Pseudoalteromonas sp.]|uniref:phosphotyrosine protein phosphatase n=1 Tax=Pseudoalteromonas sp. DL-6 TaxID=1390185 RepID=UPI000EC8F260|nr:phosphotyrosine protein phosphatase [Pseudoalteromonas sp. DL-6]QBJ61821.1 hypothetical protein B1F84_01625 [Pseudoalteromonas sp. DL-6]HCP98756.1 phosphotyrosine protein phosphatase [Pseudoalteromonas sp.]|tara:strand:- start:799 stop:1140 length:342 start_codon:yes stop_codon:yes gene_type:complete
MKVLFLCTANVQRSRTAEELFRAINKNNIYRSAGLSEKYVSKAGTTLCTEEMLNWSDKVYVFEQSHIDRLQHHTGIKYIDKVTNLRIDDNYQYFQKELVLLLLNRLPISDLEN